MADEEFHSDNAICFPSGRRLRILCGADEVIEILSPGGAVELRVTLGPDGPVLHLDASRLELHASQTLSLRSDGDIDLAAEGDIHLRGTRIHLN